MFSDAEYPGFESSTSAHVPEGKDRPAMARKYVAEDGLCQGRKQYSLQHLHRREVVQDQESQLLAVGGVGRTI
jgi:hypothetical protein